MRASPAPSFGSGASSYTSCSGPPSRWSRMAFIRSPLLIPLECPGSVPWCTTLREPAIHCCLGGMTPPRFITKPAHGAGPEPRLLEAEQSHRVVRCDLAPVLLRRVGEDAIQELPRLR